jgi:hypothetical protein
VRQITFGERSGGSPGQRCGGSTPTTLQRITREQRCGGSPAICAKPETATGVCPHYRGRVAPTATPAARASYDRGIETVTKFLTSKNIAPILAAYV